MARAAGQQFQVVGLPRLDFLSRRLEPVVKTDQARQGRVGERVAESVPARIQQALAIDVSLLGQFPQGGGPAFVIRLPSDLFHGVKVEGRYIGFKQHPNVFEEFRLVQELLADGNVALFRPPFVGSEFDHPTVGVYGGSLAESCFDECPEEPPANVNHRPRELRATQSSIHSGRRSASTLKAVCAYRWLKRPESL